MELCKLEKIFNDCQKFLTLKEIYKEFSDRYDVSVYADYKSAIRTAINRNCIDRDLNTKGRDVFISCNPKGVVGQKFGLFKWIKQGDLDTITLRVKHRTRQEQIIPEALSFDKGSEVQDIANKLSISDEKIIKLLGDPLVEERYQDEEFLWRLSGSACFCKEIVEDIHQGSSDDKWGKILLHVKNNAVSFDEIVHFITNEEITMSQMEEVSTFLEDKGIRIVY